MSRPVPRVGHAVLGGTFDRLHVGHAALLATAFRRGRRVSIGLTTSDFLSAHPKPGAERIQPYAVRRAALVRWLTARYARGRWRIVPLTDRFGRSVGPGVDLLVVSAETAGGGRAVNAERRRQGRRAVPVAVVPLVLADDLEPVSSRRIRAGAIDRRGRRRAPIAVAVAAPDVASAAAAARGVRRAMPTAEVRLVPLSPRGSARDSMARVRRAAPLGVLVRRRPGGWSVLELSPRVALTPRTVSGVGPTALATGVAEVLRPRRPQPL